MVFSRRIYKRKGMEKLLRYFITVWSFLIIGGLFSILSANSQAETIQKIGSEREAVQSKITGVLVLAHGMHGYGHGAHVSNAVPQWNIVVLEAVELLKNKYPLEVAFGMADPETIEDAVRKLEQKDVTDVIVVPLFISSHSPIIGNSRYIFGLQEELPLTTEVKSLPRIESKMRFVMTGALDDNPLAAEILLERARELSTDPDRETVILVGHGPNDENENKLWLNDMEKLASYVHEKGRFKEVKAATWRSDAPETVKEKAAQELRVMVERDGKDGRVIVIPHLLASSGVEGEIVKVLKGHSYSYNGKTLLPHPNITKWIEMQVEGELMKLKGRQR
jgi:sirohydrochlorin cobaltochelatase